MSSNLATYECLKVKGSSKEEVIIISWNEGTDFATVRGKGSKEDIEGVKVRKDYLTRLKQ